VFLGFGFRVYSQLLSIASQWLKKKKTTLGWVVDGKKDVTLGSRRNFRVFGFRV
jgi:hypothetical protein